MAREYINTTRQSDLWSGLHWSGKMGSENKKSEFLFSVKNLDCISIFRKDVHMYKEMFLTMEVVYSSEG